MHDRLEPEAPGCLKEVEDARRATGYGRLAIRAHLAFIVNLVEGQLRAAGGDGSEEVFGLARSHLRMNSRALGNTRIVLRLCDRPPLVDESLEIADRIAFDHQ